MLSKLPERPYTTRREAAAYSRFGCAAAFSAVVLGLCLRVSAQSATVRPSATRQLEQAAATAREKGDTQESLKLYQRALAGDPSWQEGWWYCGSLLYDANQYGAASSAFHKLVALNKELGNGWAMQGLSA